MELAQTEGTIYELLNQAEEKINQGGSRFPGQTYEEGIIQAIMWVIGDSDEYPYPES